MMVTVVVVFTICWLPFNVMQLFLDYEIVRNWTGLPYLWFSFHWLAMSHACYNPFIYAFMNNRFKIGFIGILSQFRCTRHLLSKYNQKAFSGLALTGVEGTEYSLNRRPTATTYISVKNKNESLVPMNIINC
ncbi:hypothetical protein RUM43_001013 [Polyplax serrata]|uniref:G-protein coupled receptors family 1 profile domain-containing protein n=1 Tax=Polyplax serrata TaxID=468196 RepID=A0AAN8SE97_POLSC